MTDVEKGCSKQALVPKLLNTITIKNIFASILFEKSHNNIFLLDKMVWTILTI
jgi:hypothetical protein